MVELTDTTMIVFALLGVLGYISMEYKYIEDGMPMLLTGVSVMGVVLWQVDLFGKTTMMMTFAIHSIGLAALVVINEVR